MAHDEKMVRRVSDIELEEIVTEKGWKAIAFLAADSISCGFFRPEFEKFANVIKAVSCAEILTDENPSITERLGVTVVPTLLIFCHGKEVAHYEGPYSAEALVTRVSELLKTSK